MTQAATMTEQAVELLARLEEIGGNKAGAFTLRSVGAVGTVFEQKLNAVLAALQGSATLPSEAITDEMIEAGIRAWDDPDGMIEAGERCIYLSGMIDADSDMSRADIRRVVRTTFETMLLASSRLSPTPDTGLIEALRDCEAPLTFAKESGYPGIDEITANLRIALANAAPAQVESGK